MDGGKDIPTEGGRGLAQGIKIFQVSSKWSFFGDKTVAKKTNVGIAACPLPWDESNDSRLCVHP